MADKIKSYVALILDRSGSMHGIREVSLNNFNEQLQTLKEESNAPDKIAKKMLAGSDSVKGVETKVSVITFNDHVDTLFFDKDVNEINELALDDYVPSGMTALYDAIGQTIDAFCEHYDDLDDPDVGVLFVIVTDGEENSSKAYPNEEGRKKLKSKIDELQKTNKWTFTFMGANQDVLETAVKGLGMFAGNAVAFAATDYGVNTATETQTSSLRSYYSARRDGYTSSTSFYEDVEDNKEKNKKESGWTTKK